MTMSDLKITLDQKGIRKSKQTIIVRQTNT